MIRDAEIRKVEELFKGNNKKETKPKENNK